MFLRCLAISAPPATITPKIAPGTGTERVVTLPCVTNLRLAQLAHSQALSKPLRLGSPVFKATVPPAFVRLFLAVNNSLIKK